MPFDRLVAAVDRWAGEHPEHTVVATLGESELRPAHLEWTKLLSPPDYQREVEAADAIVGHAGIGTLLSAIDLGKPIAVMPREGERRETRNDHQIHTARRFDVFPDVHVAWRESDLATTMERLLASIGHGGDSEPLRPATGLIEGIAAFIDR